MSKEQNIKEKIDELEAELDVLLTGEKSEGTTLSFESDILPEFEDALAEKSMRPFISQMSQLLIAARTTSIYQVRFFSTNRVYKEALEELGKNLRLDLDEVREFIVSFCRFYRLCEQKDEDKNSE